ncbi:MAG: Hsp20/alpha crystallin family protein [Patescibacteria group bacterium]|jgi:HSP20 family protein
MQSSQQDWFGQSDEAQLSVDVFREGNELVVRSLVAGVTPEDLDIAVNGDLLTIRGKREHTRDTSSDDWFYKECYWGSFSRSVVLPNEVASDSANASLKNGILEIRFPVREAGKKLKVTWED